MSTENATTKSGAARKLLHGLIALIVFGAAAGAMLLATGTLKAGAGEQLAAGGHEGHGHEKDACGEHDGCGDKETRAATKPAAAGCADGCDHDAPPGKTDTHEEHGHEGHAPAPAVNLPPAEIEKARCEHKVRTIDCDECRYETGVVKIGSEAAAGLLRTAVAKQSPLATTLRLTGQVRYDQTAVVELAPPAAGRIVSVKAGLGKTVEPGEVLAVLHSSEFGEAKAAYLESLATTEIALKERERQLAVTAAMEKLLAAPVRADGKLEAGNEPLGEWRSKLVGAAARLRQAQAVFEREKALFGKQASSKAELETAEREHQTAAADYSALVEDTQLNLKLNRLRAESAARQAEAKLAAAEQRLYVFGLSKNEVDRVKEMREGSTFAHLEIRAPRGGVVVALNATEGRFTEASANLCTIADTTNVWIWCDLYERDLAALHVAMGDGTTRASVRVASIPQPLEGTVDLIGGEISESTRTVKVRVQVANPRRQLRPGMFAEVTVQLGATRQSLLVPRGAVLSDEGRQFAFQQWKDGLWLRRFVTTGRVQDGQMEVVSGLEAGAVVVAEGAFMLKSDVLRAKMGAGCAD